MPCGYFDKCLYLNAQKFLEVSIKNCEAIPPEPPRGSSHVCGPSGSHSAPDSCPIGDSYSELNIMPIHSNPFESFIQLCF